MADDAASRLPEDRQNFAPGARRNLSHIKDRVRTVHPGEDIVAGVRVLDTSGHTAGHIAIELVSEHQALLVVGDALTHPVISFEHPEWRPASDDHDADRAVATPSACSIAWLPIGLPSLAITCRSPALGGRA